ncbi:SPASM domain-containing protein [Parasulfuritortus cantonensis]|uniref:SPASM domain-containing protein n=1 Tax=Parasulfuritortus cantonensis TaxID=2528202 RepID=A0A4R1BIV8_9PROT|nr:radical SAM protein [Parasulfuritortus cantonensis]TCJ17204.1 SPASM domain-containing protein [Parasulfuritortus cantonensis]
MTGAVKPFHLVARHGEHGLIDIEAMRAWPIEAGLAGQLAALLVDPDARLDAAARDRLDALAMLDDGAPARRPPAELPPVTNAVLFLNQYCNLRCTYCYGDHGRYGAAGRMHPDTARQAVRWLLAQAGTATVVHLGFLGGEPLLDFPLLREVTDYALAAAAGQGKDVDFYLTTNGTLLDDEIVAFLQAHRFKVQVSLDGPAGLHDRQRPFANGRASHAHIVPGVEALLAALPGSGAHATLVGDSDPATVVRALLDLGFREISILPATPAAPVGDAGRDSPAYMHWLEAGAEDWLAAIRARDADRLGILVSSTSLYAGIVSFLNGQTSDYPCGAGMGMVAIDRTGEVYPCQRFVGAAEFRLGSIAGGGLRRARYATSPVVANADCAGCVARRYCAGGCRHDHLAATGSDTTPAPDLCRIRRRQFELAAWVVSRLTPDEVGFLRAADILPARPCPLDFL